MDILFGILFLLLTTLGFFAGLFLVLGQVVWGIIDVAVSKRLSGGAKATIILLTFLLLGPLMTFLYACFGTQSKPFRRTTLAALVVMIVCCGSVLVLAGIHDGTRDRLGTFVERDGGVVDVDTLTTDDLDLDDFKAVHYVPVAPSKWSVSVSDFNASGPIQDSGVPVTVPSIYPLNQIALDPSSGRTYGITTHKFGYIVPATGYFVELETDPTLPELSWPSAIAFDESSNRVIVAGRNIAYTYDPQTGAWESQQSFGKLGLVSLAYDREDGVFFGLVSEVASDSVDSIVQLDGTGSVLSVIRLTRKLPVSELPDGRVQLVKSGRTLVLLVSAHYRRIGRGEEQRFDERMYVVDPHNGRIALVRS